MAHLIVYRETVIDQENVSYTNKRNEKPASIGKHTRASHHDPDFEQNGIQGLGTKRRALGQITNKPVPPWVISDSLCHPVNLSTQPSSIQNTISSSFSELALLPTNVISSNGSQNLFGVTQHGDRKVSLGSVNRSSFSISFGSPGSFSSPMLLSPDGLRSHSECDMVVDIDQVDDSNCAVTGEYASDIFIYLRAAEERFQPNVNYMQQQPDITNSMRCILIDWLVEVCDEFKLDQHTLYLGISIVDRFLSLMSVMRSKLQLVGAASIYLAAKFEEIYPPEIADFVYITDDTYTKLQIARMEMLILKALDFNLLAPTVHTFLLRYLKASEADQLCHTRPSYLNVQHESIPDSTFAKSSSALSMYLCELAVLNGDSYIKYPPSVIAASALCLARHTLHQPAWVRTLEHYSGYSVSDISNCVQDLHRTFAMATNHPQQAIRNKYNSETYLKVASLKVSETLPC